MLLRSLIPACVLGLGVAGLSRIGNQRAIALEAPLSSLPGILAELPGTDFTVSGDEQRVAGMDTYLLRSYMQADSSLGFSLYVGYYERQQQGRSIHSPKNCLPGAGWEPLSAGTIQVWDGARGDSLTVNRYLLENEGRRALVYYWYQGRGRVAWNEYRVKWDLMRDKARWGRSEEALVRIVVPITPRGVLAADRLAQAVAAELLPPLTAVLPGAPTT